MSTILMFSNRLLSDESEFSTFYENVFNGARCWSCQTLWLLVLKVEDVVISWVEWARFEFCTVLESQFFRSEL